MVIKLKIYYIFNIRRNVYDLYKSTPSVLYNFFYQLYVSNKEDLNIANSVFKEIANKYNKEFLDLKIYIKMHNKYKYLKKGENHIINDLFKNEISIMKVKNSYIVINSNNAYTEFFSILGNFYKECLVCDFNNQKYFYLTSIKTLV